MLVTIACACAVVCFLYAMYARKQHKLFPEIPGPSPKPILGNLDSDFLRFHELHERWVHKYGPVVKYFLGLHPVILVSSPELVKEITQTNSASFINHTKGLITATKKQEGLFSARDDHWRRTRKTISPVFNSNQLRGMMPLINERTDMLLKTIDKKRSIDKGFDIYAELQKLTLDVIGTTAFGVKFNTLGTEGTELTRAVNDIFSNVTMAGASLVGFVLPVTIVPLVSELMRTFPVGRFKSLMRGFEFCANQVQTIVKQRRSGSKSEKDFVDLLINANLDGQSLSDNEIRDNCLTFLLAGHETSANTLAFLIYLLAQHKDVEQKLIDEITATFGQNGVPETYEQIQACRYMDMVINESQRLLPVVPLTTREAVEDVTIGGYSIPKGTQIHIPIYTMHRDANNWPEPEKFDPERFRTFEVNAQPKVTFMPFGYGPRSCVGIRFAQIEMKMVIARLYQKYTFRLMPGQIPLKTTPGATLSPTSGVYVAVELRKY